MTVTTSHQRVAIAQIDSAPGDIRANVAKHLEMIERARQAGVQLLLFPELSLTGYGVGARSFELAIGADDPMLRQLADAAADMIVCVGYIEEDRAAQFYNSSSALTRGKVLFTHRKLNLPTYGRLEEGKFFATGRYLETFLLAPPYRAALLICADSWNPALVQLAVLHGATMLLFPANSAQDAVSGEFSSPDGWDLLLRFYAMIYGVPVLFANRVGQESKELSFWGGSKIIDPFGVEISTAGREEELLIADLDYQAVRRARFQLPTVRDSNLALIRRELDRLATRIGRPDEEAE